MNGTIKNKLEPDLKSNSVAYNGYMANRHAENSAVFFFIKCNKCKQTINFGKVVFRLEDGKNPSTNVLASALLSPLPLFP
jgi:adenine-specific DNA methylase